MKATVWRQFSSNHSASFTLIGIFATDTEAQVAAETLRVLLRDIRSFYGDPNFWPDYAKSVTDEFRAPPTPPEVAAAQRYGVEWPVAIDWLDRSMDAGKAVALFDNMLILEPLKEEAWQGPRPLDTLVAKFGGTVHLQAEWCSGYPDSVLLASVSCVAPHAESAEWIEFVLRDNVENGANSYVEAHLFAGAPPGCDEATSYSRVLRSGNAIKIEDAHFYEGPGWGLAKVLGFLHSEHCTDIAYAIKAVTPRS